MRDLSRAFSEWLAGPVPVTMGELSIRRHPDGFELRHSDDWVREDLDVHLRPEDARSLGAVDDEGKHRPLKSAPTLRHGWRLIVPSSEALRRALDHFYPAAAGILFDWRKGAVTPVNLRETLGRQSGMYAVTQGITDEQAQTTIGECCESGKGCLKLILWKITPDVPIRSLPGEKVQAPGGGDPGRNIPLLCHEACHFLVAKARKTVTAAAGTSPNWAGDSAER